MPQDVQMLEQANHQRARARVASFDAMMAKKPATASVNAKINDDEDEYTFKFVAIPGPAYDSLVTAHPPTPAQLKTDPNANINGDTFPPALLAKVCKEPSFSEEQWVEIFTNPAWNRGELTSLYWEANSLCNKPLDLSPFVPGSGETRPSTSS